MIEPTATPIRKQIEAIAAQSALRHAGYEQQAFAVFRARQQPPTPPSSPSPPTS